MYAATHARSEEDYLAWAARDMDVVLHTQLSLRNTVGEERGVFCLENVPSDSLVVSIPFESLLSVAHIQRHQEVYGETWPFESLTSSLREDDVLALLLLTEKYIYGEGSKWHKHIQLLPTRYHNALNLTRSELEAIRGTDLSTVARSWQTQVRRDFQELSLMPLPGGGTVGSFGFFTLEEYMWALSSIFSRFVTIQRRGVPYKVMAPVFDMFNHSLTSNTAHGFQDTNDCLHIVTFQEWSAGEELFINYGAMSNERLMMLYGFCHANNPFDHMGIWATMDPAAPGYITKQQVLETYEVKHTSEPFKLAKQVVPLDLIQTIRVQRATDDELDRLHDAMQGGHISFKNEEEVFEVLERTLETMLEGLQAAGSHDRDQEQLVEWELLGQSDILRSAPASERYKQLVLFRYTQREILSSVLKKVREYFTLSLERIQICDQLYPREQSPVGVLILNACALQRHMVGKIISLVERKGLRMCLLKMLPSGLGEEGPLCVLAAVGTLARHYCAVIADTMNERSLGRACVRAIDDPDTISRVLQEHLTCVWESCSAPWVQES